MKKFTMFSVILTALIFGSSIASMAVLVPYCDRYHSSKSHTSQDIELRNLSLKHTQVVVHKGVLIPHINLAAVDVVAEATKNEFVMAVVELQAVDIIAESTAPRYYKTVENNGELLAHMSLNEVVIEEPTVHEMVLAETNSEERQQNTLRFSISMPSWSFKIMNVLLNIFY